MEPALGIHERARLQGDASGLTGVVRRDGPRHALRDAVAGGLGSHVARHGGDELNLAAGFREDGLGATLRGRVVDGHGSRGDGGHRLARSGLGGEQDGVDELGHAVHTVVMDEVVPAELLRVADGLGGHERVRAHEEVAVGEDGLSAVDAEGVDLDDVQGHVRSAHVECEGDDVHVQHRGEVRGAEQVQLGAVGCGRHVHGVVQTGQETQLGRVRTDGFGDSHCRVLLLLARGGIRDIGHLHAIEAVLAVILNEQVAHDKVLVPRVGRVRGLHERGHHGGQAVGGHESTLEHAVVDGDGVVVLAVDAMEVDHHVGRVALEHVLVADIGVIGAALNECRCNLLDGIAVGQHAALEGSEGVLPALGLEHDLADAVHQRVDELVHLGSVRGQGLNGLGDISLRDGGDALLVRERRVRADGVQDIRIGGIERKKLGSGHYIPPWFIGLKRSEMWMTSPSSVVASTVAPESLGSCMSRS